MRAYVKALLHALTWLTARQADALAALSAQLKDAMQVDEAGGFIDALA